MKNRLIVPAMLAGILAAGIAQAAFQQDAGAYGIVSMEAENNTSNTGQGGKTWSADSTSGYSGTGALRAMPDTGVTNNASSAYLTGSPRLNFDVNFVKTGTHYIWVRCRKSGGGNDTLHAGIDGVHTATADRIANNGSNNTWVWTSITLDSSSRATFSVASPGTRTVNIWMREDGIRVDKIVLTTSSSYTPTGTGPAESSQGGGDTTPPSAPTGLTATAGDAVVNLDWANNSEPDLASYSVKRSTTSGGPYSVVAPGLITSQWSDTTVTNGTTYYYVVSATDAASNQSADSTQASATPQAPAGCAYGARPALPSGLTVYVTGNAADSCIDMVGGPGVYLEGGNFDVAAGFQTWVKPIVQGGDVVVLRTTGSDGYNDYLMTQVGADSVETILLTTAAQANSAYVDWVIRSAEFVWMAGGDQSTYLNAWQGTLAEDAIRHVYEKGGVVGGISAGNAVMGEFIYDPDGVGSAYSATAVSNPCHSYINISTDFLNLPLMEDIVTDTHFQERNRMGRLLVFMGKIREPGLLPDSNAITGIGVDEDTAIFIDANRVGHVDGSGSVFVLREDAATQRVRVQCGSKVIYRDVLRTRLVDLDEYNFNTHAHTGVAEYIGVDGDQCTFSLTQTESCFYEPDTNPY